MQDYWIPGTSQIYFAGFFIILAAIFDLFDGAVARWLNEHSAIGKDLDSLADVVSFGVAPSMIVMKLLWISAMQSPDALDVSMWAVAPAFLIACFAALRLATFNNSEPTTAFFTGVPVPAVGMLIAFFPLIYFYNPLGMASVITNEWVLYLIIGFLCWIMNCKFKFFTLKGLMKGAIKENILPLACVILSIAAVAIFRSAGAPIAFVLYVAFSLAMQKKLV